VPVGRSVGLRDGRCEKDGIKVGLLVALKLGCADIVGSWVGGSVGARLRGGQQQAVWKS